MHNYQFEQGNRGGFREKGVEWERNDLRKMGERWGQVEGRMRELGGVFERFIQKSREYKVNSEAYAIFMWGSAKEVESLAKEGNNGVIFVKRG